MNLGFDNDKYLKMQSEHIRERVNSFDNKLYLEFGGKLFDDYHASRVLPGFKPDSKFKMLMEIKDSVEVVIVISAGDIERNKVRGDLGITYDEEVLRLIDLYNKKGLFVGSVCITQYTGQQSADLFKTRLLNMGVNVYTHYYIEGYPHDVSRILSDEGYGRNEYIKTTKPIIVITAPGPGSGKMATCLSQLYAENKRGINAGYAKFETFPIWNLPLKHPVNLAYEAATADLNDLNMIDHFHLEAYGKTTVNYNRDIEIFPVLKATFEKIYGKSPYNSPTDMGVNMAGYCIINDNACKEASRQEIIRRYYESKCKLASGTADKKELYKIESIMSIENINVEERNVVGAVKELLKTNSEPVAALELNDKTILTGKTKDLLGATSSVLLNALKYLASLDDNTHILSPDSIKSIQVLKTKYFGSKNPRLHTDEVLIALSTSALSNPVSKKVLDMLPLLKDAQFHSSVILSPVDIKCLKKLGVMVTCDSVYNNKEQ